MPDLSLVEETKAHPEPCPEHTGRRVSPSHPLLVFLPLCHRWLPVLAWMALIFAGSSRSDLPTHPNDGVDTLAKKAIHSGEYGVLAALLWRALAHRKENTRDTLTLKVFTSSLLYALSDELHQRFIPGRCGSLVDVGYDAIGVFIALALLRRWSRPPIHPCDGEESPGRALVPRPGNLPRCCYLARYLLT